jgi:hypothetical protein
MNSAESKCDFPSYVSHYQFLFKNKWYRLFFESSGGKLAMFARELICYDGSPILRLDRVKQMIISQTIIFADAKKEGYPRRKSKSEHVVFSNHKMVALLFGSPNNSDCKTVTNLVVDHMDRDKQNYKAWNLNYLTLEQNSEATGWQLNGAVTTLEQN